MATNFTGSLGRGTGGYIVGALALALGLLMLDASAPACFAQAFGAPPQDGQPPRARTLLKSARELYAKGEYEAADAAYRQALLSRDSLTASEQHDLEAQLQQNAVALQSRQAGLFQLQQAQAALLAGKADECEANLRLAQANQFLSPMHKQQLGAMSQQLGRLRALPAEADGKSLLVRAREALAQGDLNSAEMLARQAEKQNTMMSRFQLWGDSPARVLDDVRNARSKMPAPNAVTTNYPPTVPGMTPNGPADKSQLKAQARQYVFDAHQAMTAGDYVTARRLAEQARDLNSGFEPGELTPDALLTQIAQQSSSVQAMSGATDARGVLRQARNLFVQQQLEAAEKLAIQAENMPNSRWGLFEDSPRKLRDEIVRARSTMDHDKANKLTLEARKALQRNDIAQARAFAQQAKALQGTSSFFTPWAETPDAVLRDVARAEKLHPQPAMPTNPNMPPPLPEGTVAQQVPTQPGRPADRSGTDHLFRRGEQRRQDAGRRLHRRGASARRPGSPPRGASQGARGGEDPRDLGPGRG